METVGLRTPSRDGWGLCPSHGDATTLLPPAPHGFCRADLLGGHVVAMRAAHCSPVPADWAGRGQEQCVQLGAEKTAPALVCWLLGTRYGLDIDLLDLSSTSVSRVSEEGFQVYCNPVALGAVGNDVPLGKGQPVQLSSSTPAWRGRSCCGWAASGASLLAHPSPGPFAHLRDATVLVSDCSVFHCPFPHGSFLEESYRNPLL